MKCYTRMEICDIWLNQKTDFRNKFVCPDCRDILDNVNGDLCCLNENCLNDVIYGKDGYDKLKDGEKLK